MNYFDAAGAQRIAGEYPLGARFAETTARLCVTALASLREARFRRVVARAWEIPFYQRLWGDAGIARGDIRGLADLPDLPRFTKTDLMASVGGVPPLGDYHGFDSLAAAHGAVLHTTSGTTGEPQPLLYGPRDREIQNALLARAYLLQGLRADDVVHSVYGFGMVNGGHYVREAVVHFTRALMLTPGTGLETPSARQVELMARFGVTVLVGFVDYIAKLADVARQAGLEPGRDIRIRMISGHLGAESAEAIGALWGGARVLDWYGVGDTGIVAAQLEPGAPMVVWEDAHAVEVVDAESGRPVEDGSPGNLCVTVLFKDGVYPIIRFDTSDVTAWAEGHDPRAPGFRRIRGHLGRSDNMVKLRGVNVYPTALAAVVSAYPGCTGEYLCEVSREAGGDRMTVRVEHAAGGDAKSGIRAALREHLGVGVEVVIEAPGALAGLTGIETRQKPIRLLDRRPNTRTPT